MIANDPHPCRVLAIAMALLLSVPAAEGPALVESLQQGLYAEEVARDLETAAGHYQAIVAAEDNRRATVATAMYRLAEVRRNQGRDDEAIALYQRLLIEFPRAETEGGIARERLAALGAAIPQPGGGAADPETAELARLQTALVHSPDLVTDPVILYKAAQEGWLDVVKFMLDHGADPNHEHELPILSAVGAGHLAVIQEMVAKAGLPQEAWLRAELLEEAIVGRRMTVLRYLLEQGIHPDVALETGNRTVLMELVGGAETEESRMVLNLLLEKGADPNAERATEGQRPDAFPLHLALGKRRWQHAGWLLEHGAVPDPAPDGIRPTSLHLVATRDEPEAGEMVEKLIRHGAVADAVASISSISARYGGIQAEAVTPLTVAVDHEAWDIANALIAAGADVNRPGLLARYLPEEPFAGDSREEQARILAKQSMQWRISNHKRDDELAARLTARLKFLVEAGADPNLLDPQGHHPLSLAVLAGRRDLIELLLKHGADPDIPFGKDPGELPPPPQLAVAEMRNAPGLLNYGFNPNWRVPACTPEKQVAMLRLLLDAGAKPGRHMDTLKKLIDGHDPEGELTRALEALASDVR